MHRLNWRLAVAEDLKTASAPRVITIPILTSIVSAYRPNVARSTVRSMIQDLLEMGAIRPASPFKGIYLNVKSDPQGTLAEAATCFREGAIVSLETVLGAAGVLTFAEAKLTCVLADRPPFTLYQESFMMPGGWGAQFHFLPPALLPPSVEDDGDLLDASKLYPCATPEKAFLDWLYVEQCVPGRSPSSLQPNLSRLNKTRLIRLAAKMRLEGMLDQLLTWSRSHG